MLIVREATAGGAAAPLSGRQLTVCSKEGRLLYSLPRVR